MLLRLYFVFLRVFGPSWLIFPPTNEVLELFCKEVALVPRREIL